MVRRFRSTYTPTGKPQLDTKSLNIEIAVKILQKRMHSIYKQTLIQTDNLRMKLTDLKIKVPKNRDSIEESKEIAFKT